MSEIEGLANTAWAFAIVNRSDEELPTALARAAERRARKIKSLAKTAWACAAMKSRDKKLFAVVVAVVRVCVWLLWVVSVLPTRHWHLQR